MRHAQQLVVLIGVLVVVIAAPTAALAGIKITIPVDPGTNIAIGVKNDPDDLQDIRLKRDDDGDGKVTFEIDPTPAQVRICRTIGGVNEYINLFGPPNRRTTPVKVAAFDVVDPTGTTLVADAPMDADTGAVEPGQEVEVVDGMAPSAAAFTFRDGSELDTDAEIAIGQLDAANPPTLTATLVVSPAANWLELVAEDDSDPKLPIWALVVGALILIALVAVLIRRKQAAA